MNYPCKCHAHWIILRAQNTNKNIGDFCTRLQNFHCRIICWHPVYFRSFSFVCILHICVLWDQQVCQACLLRFAGAGGIVKILFLIQWQWKPYVNCHCTTNRILTTYLANSILTFYPKMPLSKLSSKITFKSSTNVLIFRNSQKVECAAKVRFFAWSNSQS